MNVSSAISAGQAIQRVTTRLSLDFMLKVICRAAQAHDGNLDRCLAYFAIQHANVAHFSRDPDLTWAYATKFPPDEARRPISVHALAQALAFSPETTRRYVNTLINEGACERVEGKGVIVPVRYLTGENAASQRYAAMASFNELITSLNAINFDFETISVRAAPIPARFDIEQDELPVLLISRLINGYILRVLEDSVRTHGDFSIAVIFALIITLNTRHIAFDPELAWKFAGADQAPPDDLRRPASIAQIAAELGMPYSTANRKVMIMVERGLCHFQDKGLIVRTETMGRPDLMERGLNMHQWLMSTLGEMMALGLDFRHWRPAQLATERHREDALNALPTDL